jgi:hypothetical protein
MTTSGRGHAVADGEQQCGNGEVGGIDASVLLLFGMSVALLGSRPRHAASEQDGRPHSIIIVDRKASFFFMRNNEPTQNIVTTN